MGNRGKIVMGLLVPHWPHLVYAESPAQNEPKGECGWETLRWACGSLRKNLEAKDYDALVVLSSNWKTQVGTHILGAPRFCGVAVDSTFPNLFRFHYDVGIDVDLAKEICREARHLGTKLVDNPNFPLDSGAVSSCHMVHPQWKKPIVVVSVHQASSYFSVDYMQGLMLSLGEATRKAIEKSGKRVVLLASSSLSHKHFITERVVPEDMSAERIYDHGQYLWDMEVLDCIKRGKSQELIDLLPDFGEQAQGGSLAWILSALGRPRYSATIHGYGTVMGTGNAVVEWGVP